MGKVEMILLIVALILLLFGARKLPQLARSVGDSARELKKGLRGNDDDPSVTQNSEAPAKENK